MNKPFDIQKKDKWRSLNITYIVTVYQSDICMTKYPTGNVYCYNGQHYYIIKNGIIFR